MNINNWLKLRNFRLLKFFFILLLLFSINSFSEIKYRVSGRVVYNGIGVSNIKISCNYKTIYSKSDGSFSLYLMNGTHSLSVYNQKGYIRNRTKIIIKNKNVKNVIIFLKKGCTISGSVKYENGNPASGKIMVRNVLYETDIKTDGTYLINGIPEGNEIKVFVLTHGTFSEMFKNISLKDGEELKNINFIFPNKKVSLSGKIQIKNSDRIMNVDLDNLRIQAISFKEFPNPIIVSGFIKDNGEYFFYNLPDGKYHIFVSANYYKDYVFEIIINNQVESKYKLIDIEVTDELRDKYNSEIK